MVIMAGNRKIHDELGVEKNVTFLDLWKFENPERTELVRKYGFWKDKKALQRKLENDAVNEKFKKLTEK